MEDRSRGLHLQGLYVGTSPAASFVGTPPGSSAASAASSQNQAFEIEKLRMELKHVEKMYELAKNSNVDEKLLFPMNQLNTLTKELEAALTLEEQKAKEMENAKKSKLKAGQRDVVQPVKRTQESEDKLKQLLANPVAQCQKFNWNEILDATSSLSDEFKIGSGAFGTVYKCKLHHTTAAVKVLHSKDTVTNKQFLQEVNNIGVVVCMAHVFFFFSFFLCAKCTILYMHLPIIWLKTINFVLHNQLIMCALFLDFLIK